MPALLTLPATGSTSRPAVLLQHGGEHSKDSRIIGAAMRRWARAGFVCMAIDAPAHGERPSDIGLSEREGRRLVYRRRDLRVQNVVDLRRAIDYLETRPEVDNGRIGFWGVSMGAFVGVQLMAVEKRVRAGCLALGGGGYRWSAEGMNEGEARLLRLLMDPASFAGEIAPRPVLMLNGVSDETIGRAATEALYNALGEPKELRWFSAGHAVTAGMLKASLAFFQKELG